MTRDPARSGRRAPIGLETLEPRVLLAGRVSSPTPGERWLIPAQAAASGSAVVAFVGPISTTDPEPVVGTQGAGVAPVQSNARPRPPTAPAPPTPSGQVAAGAYTGTTLSYGVTPTGAGSGWTVSVSGTVAANGPQSTGPGPPATIPHGGPGLGPSTLPVATAGAASSPTSLGRSNAPATPSWSPSPSIGVGPLPASPYEPAGGIFRVVGPTPRVDRVEETRVEMSLVRLLSPGPEGSREDGRIPVPDPAASVARLASDSAPPRDVLARTGPSQPGGPSVAHPLGPIAADPGLLAAEDPVWATRQVAAATPPIDGPDRPTDNATGDRKGDSIDRGGRVASRSGPRQAIFLGLGGSAVLGFGLYAPDLAAAVRRAGPRPLQRTRTRRWSRRNRPGRWPAPPPSGD